MAQMSRTPVFKLRGTTAMVTGQHGGLGASQCLGASWHIHVVHERDMLVSLFDRWKHPSEEKRVSELLSTPKRVSRESKLSRPLDRSPHSESSAPPPLCFPGSTLHFKWGNTTSSASKGEPVCEGVWALERLRSPPFLLSLLVSAVSDSVCHYLFVGRTWLVADGTEISIVSDTQWVVHTY